MSQSTPRPNNPSHSTTADSSFDSNYAKQQASSSYLSLDVHESASSTPPFHTQLVSSHMPGSKHVTAAPHAQLQHHGSHNLTQATQQQLILPSSALIDSSYTRVIAHTGAELSRLIDPPSAAANSSASSTSSAVSLSSSGDMRDSDAGKFSHAHVMRESDYLATSMGVYSEPLFITTQHGSLQNNNSFNAVPVRRCLFPADAQDLYPHLPPVLVRMIKPLALGESLVMLRDSVTSEPKIIQCKCKQWLCQYHMHCDCTDLQCAWPEIIHDGQLPHYHHVPPIDSVMHPKHEVVMAQQQSK